MEICHPPLDTKNLKWSMGTCGAQTEVPVLYFVNVCPRGCSLESWHTTILSEQKNGGKFIAKLN